MTEYHFMCMSDGCLHAFKVTELDEHPLGDWTGCPVCGRKAWTIEEEEFMLLDLLTKVAALPANGRHMLYLRVES